MSSFYLVTQLNLNYINRRKNEVIHNKNKEPEIFFFLSNIQKLIEKGHFL